MALAMVEGARREGRLAPAHPVVELTGGSTGTSLALVCNGLGHPLTIVAKARTEVPELITAGTGTVGVRLPDDEGARATVRAFVGGLTATSANPAGRPPAPPHSPRATSRAASASS